MNVRCARLVMVTTVTFKRVKPRGLRQSGAECDLGTVLPRYHFTQL